jgi:hypothetical protein
LQAAFIFYISNWKRKTHAYHARDDDKIFSRTRPALFVEAEIEKTTTPSASLYRRIRYKGNNTVRVYGEIQSVEIGSGKIFVIENIKSSKYVFIIFLQEDFKQPGVNQMTYQ